MKFKTVRQGQQAVVYNHLGEGRLIVGPERVFLHRERLQYLKDYTADQYQFLILKDNDGILTHKRGPCVVFHNPMLYESITVRDATKIDANHLIVVYKRLKDDDVQRRIIQGPTVFVPEAEEWVHQFKWHGTDASDKTRMIPGHNEFTQLAVIPDQFYYNVREVRTNDDVMITVKLMIFYEMKDILKMLDTTHDPIADMINAVCADVIAFSGKITFESFLMETDKLSDLKTYPQLTNRAQRIGYQIQKVVFRGYHASDKLLAMQCSAIESRTKLRLNAEMQERKQKLADFVLNKEQQRSKLKQEMEKEKQEHQQKVKNLKQTHELEVKDMRHEHDLKLRSMATKTDMEYKNLGDKEMTEFLEQLRDLDVDTTKYLNCQQEPRTKEEIRFVDPQVHTAL